MSTKTIDEPFLVSTSTRLELIWTSENTAFGFSFWLPVPPSGYRNVGHFVEGGKPKGLVKITNRPILFIREDPFFSKRIDNFVQLWNSVGSGANNCTVFDAGCVGDVTALRGVSPDINFVVMGDSFVPFLNVDPGSDRFKVWAVNKDYVIQLNNLFNFAAVAGSGNIGSDDNSSIFFGDFHLFRMAATPYTAMTPPAGVNFFYKFSLQDRLACCRNAPLIATDPGRITPAFCGVFFGPTHDGSCDAVLVDYCRTVTMDDQNCGCILPPEFYQVTKLVGPAECVDNRCVSVPTAYKLKAQRTTKCGDIVNCVISNVIINAPNSTIDKVAFNQVCGNKTGGGTGATGAAGGFSTFIRSPLGIGLIVGGLLLIGIIIFFAIRTSSRRKAEAAAVVQQDTVVEEAEPPDEGVLEEETALVEEKTGRGGTNTGGGGAAVETRNVQERTTSRTVTAPAVPARAVTRTTVTTEEKM